MLTLALLLTVQISVLAASSLKSNSYLREIAGVTYLITDEYDDDGARHITYQSEERTIIGSYDGETIYISSPEGEYTFDFTFNENEIEALQKGQEIVPMRANYCSKTSAIGYSGAIYSYSNYNWKITLQAGNLSATGSHNSAAAGFYNEVVKMGQIYNSMNGLQRSAWLILRVKGFLGSLSLDAIDVILMMAGIDLKGQLESTVLGLNNWYEAEEKAKMYFRSFS